MWIGVFPLDPVVSVCPAISSYGPGRRFRFFEILEIGSLCLWLQKSSGLALNQTLPFPDGHLFARRCLQPYSFASLNPQISDLEIL